jgi:hypothetical protein
MIPYVDATIELRGKSRNKNSIGTRSKPETQIRKLQYDVASNGTEFGQSPLKDISCASFPHADHLLPCSYIALAWSVSATQCLGEELEHLLSSSISCRQG